MRGKLTLVTILTLTTLLGSDAFGAGRLMLRNICRVKGQEENTLRGLGLVVGLNGTGEAGDLQTMRALSSMMEIMGSPVSTTGRTDAKSLEDLKKFKNAALVMVSATVPATGARRGSKIDCFVTALNGKSLEGGRLAFASLQGPNTQDHHVYALCEGQLVVDNSDLPTVARVHKGCQMQEDVITPFEKDGFITLILDESHADFVVASAIGDEIRQKYRSFVDLDATADEDDELARLAQVVDASTIRVKIPDIYADDPVLWVAELMEVPVYSADPEARVVVNPRSETVVISGDVVIGDVIVTHRNLTVEVSNVASVDFRKVGEGVSSAAKLDDLVAALKNLEVPAGDIIEIIKGIERNGKLHGKLIYD